MVAGGSIQTTNRQPPTGLLVLLRRDEDLLGTILAAAHNAHERGATGGDARELALRFGRRCDPGAADTDDHVAPLQQIPRRRAFRIDGGDHRAADVIVQAQLPRDLGRQGFEIHAEPGGRRRLRFRSTVAVLGDARAVFRIEVELLDGDIHRALLFVAQDAHRHGGSRLGRGDHPYELVPVLHRLTVVGQDHIADLDARLVSGGAFGHGSDERAGALLQTELVECVAVDRPDADADAAAGDLAAAQLRQQLAYRIARDGEADAHVALRQPRRRDGGIDPDDLAAKVQQRPPRVARVDRRVRLQHVSGPALRHAQVAGAVRADDADADGVVKAERVADRHDPVAWLHLRRIAESNRRQLVIGLVGQLDQCAVGQRIPADHTRRVKLVLVLTVERHLNLRGAVDHVIVGEDQPRLVDDEPGAGGAHGLFARLRALALSLALPTAPALRRAGKAEEPVEQVVAAAAAEEVEI